MATTITSPLLDLPGAVAGDGLDAAVAAHYGSFIGEQRTLVAGEGFVDLSHREVLTVAGPDRLTLLHSLTSQAFEGLAPGEWTASLILSPQGHVEHFFSGVDDGTTFTAWTEPGHGEALIGFLDRMKFWSDVTVSAAPETAVIWRADGSTLFVPRAELDSLPAALGPAAGLWAYDALRIARGEPRFGVDTDERTIPNEVGWLPGGPVVAVHLDKGCYRGQETVARVHTLGRPPRRLTLLHLDGTENRLPAVGSPLTVAGSGDDARAIGRVGSSARHHEWGPIALALVKRNVDPGAPLLVDGIAAAQEVVVDPEVGLHVRPLR